MVLLILQKAHLPLLKGDGVVVSPNIKKEVGINPTLPPTTETKSLSPLIQQEKLVVESKLPTPLPSQEIRGTERNSPSNVTVTLSKEDIKSIADAVKDGASKANINVNLDGNRVSNTLQTPLAMNTRKYGI